MHKPAAISDEDAGIVFAIAAMTQCSRLRCTLGRKLESIVRQNAAASCT
jgi:hypothetical protein